MTNIIILAATTAICAQDTLRQRDYPMAVAMDNETTEWRQDVYRQLNVRQRENAGLYSPATQKGRPQGLFAVILQAALAKKLPLYAYVLDGNEQYDQQAQIPVTQFLDDFHITYQEDSTKTITADNRDVPYADITVFYVREALYYDLRNSAYRKKVVALCPVMVTEGDFGEEPTRYPLFWVRYDELAKFLRWYVFTPDGRNIAMQMSYDDFFTRNLYKGDIYKVYDPNGTAVVTMTQTDSLRAATAQQQTKAYQTMKARTYDTYHGRTVAKKTKPEQPKNTKNSKRHRKRKKHTDADTTETPQEEIQPKAAIKRRQQHDDQQPATTPRDSITGSATTKNIMFNI